MQNTQNEKNEKNEEIDAKLSHQEEIYQNEINEIIQIMKKKGEVLNKNQYYILYDFFQSTKFDTLFKEDMDYGEINSQSLFSFISPFIEMGNFHNKESIYCEGTSCDKIYLLLDGKVSLYHLEYDEISLSGTEYYLKLFSMYEKGDKFLLEKTIEANKDIFPVNRVMDIVDIKNTIINIKVIQYASIGDTNGLINFLQENNRDPEQYNFERVINKEISIEDFYQKQIDSIGDKQIFYYDYINNKNENVKIMKLIISESIERKGFFGLFSLKDKEPKRKETAISEDNTVVLQISKKNYGNNVMLNKKSIKDQEIENIYQNSFFHYLRKKTFVNAFFSKLEIREIAKGEYLYKENDPLDYIYIIKKGKVEFNLESKSLMQIKRTISYIKNLDPAFNKDFYDDTLNMKNSLNVLMSFIHQKKNYSLFVLDKGIIGIWENVYNCNMLYNIQIFSEKAVLYRISVKKFEEITKHMALITRGINREAYEKLSALYERLIMIKNSILMKIDFEFSKKLQEEEDKYYSNFSLVNPKKNEMTYLTNVKMNCDAFDKKGEIKYNKKSNNLFNSNENLIIKTNMKIKNNNSSNLNGYNQNDINNIKEFKRENSSKMNIPLSEFQRSKDSLFLSFLRNRMPSVKKKLLQVMQNEKIYDENIYYKNENCFPQKEKSFTLPNIYQYGLKEQINKKKESEALSPKKKRNVINISDCLGDYSYNSLNKSINYLAIHKFYETLKKK